MSTLILEYFEELKQELVTELSKLRNKLEKSNDYLARLSSPEAEKCYNAYINARKPPTSWQMSIQKEILSYPLPDGLETYRSSILDRFRRSQGYSFASWPLESWVEYTVNETKKRINSLTEDISSTEKRLALIETEITKLKGTEA